MPEDTPLGIRSYSPSGVLSEILQRMEHDEALADAVTPTEWSQIGDLISSHDFDESKLLEVLKGGHDET